MKAEQQHGLDVATMRDFFKPMAAGATFWPETAQSSPIPAESSRARLTNMHAEPNSPACWFIKIIRGLCF
ncbi:hypothetical protein [Leisingera sp. F5]|uniref:hypothetical protein n=1 Tax=Leisingera sp. F5 TaxID=1813816 RepID=UPI0025BD497E|nr:hypothetical protein [Leisingera sp. F5]